MIRFVKWKGEDLRDPGHSKNFRIKKFVLHDDVTDEYRICKLGKIPNNNTAQQDIEDRIQLAWEKGKIFDNEPPKAPGQKKDFFDKFPSLDWVNNKIDNAFPDNKQNILIKNIVKGLFDLEDLID